MEETVGGPRGEPGVGWEWPPAPQLESENQAAGPDGHVEQTALIRARSLVKRYGRDEEVLALNGVDLDVAPGELLAVMGPSGAGKSTLLNLLGGLDRPTSGKVWIDGVDVTALAEGRLHEVRRYKIGFVFQAFHLIPNLNALENVLLPTLPLGRPNAHRARAWELLASLGYGDRVERRPSELSFGQQQRVAIARALILDPPLILADEPTGNLDSRSAAEIFTSFQRLCRDQRKAIVVVTHDPRLSALADAVVYLKDGRVVDEP